MEANPLTDFKNLQEALNRYGQAAVDLYRREMQVRGKNASFSLSNQLRFDVNKDGALYTVSLDLLSYWKFIEYGRKPGRFPPIEKIREWVRIKPVVPRPMANGKLPSLQQLAFLIARKIAREGIAPEPILHDSLEELNSTYLPLIQEALTKDIGDISEAVFRTFFDIETK